MVRSYDSDAGSSYSEEEYDSEHDSDYATGTGKAQQVGVKRKRDSKTRREVKAAPKPTYTARVTATATEGIGPSEDTESKIDSADSNVLAKIRKAMKLAVHPGTGEAEAKAAMRMATKLMQSQNLTQADLIANETAEERSTRAGQILWTGFSMAWPMFNTVAAALAFEMLHNQIETWAIERKGELKGHSGANSYRRGVAERVKRDVQRENRAAVRRAEEEEQKRLREAAAAEEAARAAELARLVNPTKAEPTVSPYTETQSVPVKIEDVPDLDGQKPVADTTKVDYDDDLPPRYEDGDFMYDDDLRPDFDDNDDDVADLDLDALERKVQIKSEPLSAASPAAAKPEPVEVKLECSEVKTEPSDDAPSWNSALQLRTFRDNAQMIAKNYLKDMGTKVRKGRKPGKMKHDSVAYNKGWDDGKKVDLKRRRIEELSRTETNVNILPLAEFEYDSGDDYVASDRQAGVKRKLRGTTTDKSKAKTAPTPTYIARVTATATEGADMKEDTSKVDRADSSVLARIRKAMRLAAG
ncbi:hypothetical protein LshimejAT787_1601080 [Lyophyllum shimeji]|uniref:DUF2786 domain-containing protein n=1 Tax=Lyophyllum shimeji TaxID=47721 RepID=A0A9P3PZ24_LYOSH|nr:hypothetical protein LshimejAT787_1601080 [Lyophyllum shimeji]